MSKIGILLKSVRQYKLKTFLTPVLMLGEVLCEVIIPTVTADLIDNGFYNNDMPYIVKLGIILFVLAIVQMAFGVICGKFASDAGVGFAANLRQDVFYAIQNYSFTNIDKFSNASLVTRLTTDITNIQRTYMTLIRTAFRSPLMLIFSFVMAFRISSTIASYYLMALPVLMIGIGSIMIIAHPIFTRVFNEYDKLNANVGENVRGIRVVKSFVREDYEKQKFDTTSNNIRRYFTKAERIIGFGMPLMNLCVFAIMIVIGYFGSKEIIASGNGSIDPNGMTTGMLTSCVAYAMQILMSLMMLSMVLLQVTMSRASINRVSELLREKSDITTKENAVTEIPDGSIEFENVNFAYSRNASKNVLTDINLKIESGQTIGILGSTGSSKSSLVQLIPRLYDVNEGSVKVGGIDVRDYDLDVLRKNVAMVLQKNTLFEGTIKENLRWGKEDATDEDIVRVCKLACADEFIEQFPDKYDTKIDQGGANVSGGQKQRLCIARAILRHPKILILDDSTSAVDTKTDAKIRAAFKNEIPETTKLIIAQRVASVMDADKIVVLDDGKIVDCGTHDELMKTSEIYRTIYETQMNGGDEDAE